MATPRQPRAPRELPKVLTPDEVDALLAAPNVDCPTGLRNRCMLQLMLRCGLRVTETTLLHLRDVDWNDGSLHLRPEITKGEKEAFTYIDDATLEWLKRWKAERRKYAAGQPWLFTTLKGEPVGRKYVWAMMRRFAKRAGIREEIHPHMLRHTFATDLLREDFNIREVQQLMRHNDVRTTQIYTHVDDAQLRRRMRERGQ